ncbi:MAG: peptidoglycan recognition family protein [Planctomycetota bacterium]|nr:peptidoglycan recognition family protein [Planctomycetota bacterium]
MSRSSLLLILLTVVPACRVAGPEHHVPPEQSTWMPAENDSIVVAGRKFRVGVPVVLWNEPPRYDAYSTAPRFAAADDPKVPQGLRYQPGRVRKVMRDNPDYLPAPASGVTDTRTDLQKQRSILEREDVLVAPASPDLEALRAVVDQFVLHFDVCGVSQTCFRVLHDDRGLSVQFLLDLDGTIYQTLDARETAWHATKSNPRSIGIEIANMGAYPLGVAKALDTWYAHDEGGPYVRIPERLGDGGLRTEGFVARPARRERVVGEIQGETLQQYDFTPEQYASLVKLTAALCRAFPRIEPDAPRGADGRVLDHALGDAEWREFRGILGHYHVQKNKTDPGPAFDWEPFLAAVRERLALAPVTP